MTQLSWIYIIPGLISFVWPIYFILFKHKVSPVQWLYTISGIIIGFTICLYASLFNVHLQREYFLVLLYQIMALLSPPVLFLYVTKLTNPNGITLQNRRSFIPSVVVSIVLVASAMVAGRDTFHYYIDRVMLSSNSSLIGDWGYNQLVVCGKYIFLPTLILEVVVLSLISIPRFFKYFDSLNDYMVARGRKSLVKSNKNVLIFIILSIVVCAVVLGFNPLYELRDMTIIVSISTILSVDVLLLGFVASGITVTAEEIEVFRNLGDRRSGEISWMGTQAKLARYREIDSKLVNLIETENGYLNPKLTFEEVADTINAGHLELIDVVHLLHGCSYFDYIDSLRINRAISMILIQSADDDALMLSYKIKHTDFLKPIVTECAYDSVEIFEKKFKKIMNVSIFDWALENVSG